MRIPYLVLAYFFLVVLTSSCAPIVIGGAGAAAFLSGKMVAQDKTIGTSISDTTIWAKIRAGLAKHHIDNVLGTVSIEIQEGRVLLTGTVSDKNKVITILRVCWNTNGVKEVINELRIKDQKPSALDNIKDSWITTKIKSKLLASREIKSINYSVESIDGVVYLLGIAQSHQELDKVIELASKTASVKRVVSYVRVKKDLSNLVAETKGIKIEEDPVVSSQEDYNEDIHIPYEPVIVPPPTVHSSENPVVQDETISSLPRTSVEPKIIKPERKASADSSDSVFEKDDF